MMMDLPHAARLQCAAAALLLALGSGCASPSTRHDEVHILSSSTYLRPHASPADAKLCAPFHLTPAQVGQFFRTAQRVDPLVFNQEAIILPCGMEGTLRRGTQQYHWRILPTGAGYLFTDMVDERYLSGEQ